MITGNSISQINRALENSFSAIKRDMNELKLIAHTNADQFSTLRKDIEALKGESAPKDKMNVLKIKVGELNEEIKKMWELDKKIEALKAPQFDRKSLRIELNELNTKLIATELRLQEYNKRAATEAQVRSVVTNVNTEFNKVLAELRNIEIKKDELGRKIISQFESKIDKKFAAEHDAISALRKEVKNYVHKDELKVVIKELSNDLDSMRKELATSQKDNKAFVKEGEIQNLVKNINKEFDGVAHELESIKKQGKEFVTAGQIKGLIKDIADEFDDVKSQISSLQDVKSDSDKFRKQTEKVVSQMQKQVKTSKVSDSYGASVVMNKPMKVASVQPYRKTYAFGNVMIFASFMLLIASIGSYYFSMSMAMDNFAVGAVATFVVGMIARMTAVLKGR
ncbi:MAG TPA: hypothetical protein VKE88_00735 [Candidatus Nanoarchaeia archaeon]|nr:hypothetical protein [Candidatus Nanoarchaeia archaeon]